MVYGSSEIFTENADQMVSGSNSGMFSDTLSQFVSTDGIDTVIIPVKSYDNSQLMVSAVTGALVGISLMALLPILLLAVGIVIWVKRRKR